MPPEPCWWLASALRIQAGLGYSRPVRLVRPGDDSNPANGSERMPSISVNNNNNGFSNFAFNGNPYIAREAQLSQGMSGTWVSALA